MVYPRGFIFQGAMLINIHAYIVPTIFTELLYPLQDGCTPLHHAAWGGHPTIVECLLSTPGIDVDIAFLMIFLKH